MLIRKSNNNNMMMMMETEDEQKDPLNKSIGGTNLAQLM